MAKPSRFAAPQFYPSQTKKTPVPKNDTSKPAVVKKLYILDACVLITDPRALFAFKEHDIYIPLPVLGQLDNHKKGQDEGAFHARETTRLLVEMLMDGRKASTSSVSLEKYSDGEATGFIHTVFPTVNSDLLSGKCENQDVDNRLIQITQLLGKSLQDKYTDVVLVSLDGILIASALLHPERVSVEFYRNGRIEDVSNLYTGTREVNDLFAIATDVQRSGMNIKATMRGTEFGYNEHVLNQRDKKLYRVVQTSSRQVVFRDVPLRDNPKDAILHISARAGNIEQSCAMDVLLDPKVPLVLLQGEFGSGKSLLAVVTGIKQVIDHHYDGILYVRSQTPAGGKTEEVGFLPGDMGSKTAQWLGAVDDSVEAIIDSFPKEESVIKGASVKGGGTKDTHVLLVRSTVSEHLQLQTIHNVRGRTFRNKFVIIDESQNLSRSTLKAILSRVGENSKVVMLSDVKQIDSPYLDIRTCGVSFFAAHAPSSPLCAKVSLPKCERSELAQYIASFM